MQVHNIKAHWQHKLDKTQYELVFKNLRKTAATTHQHPRGIFTDNVLNPMALSPKDEARLTPITVININKENPTQN